MWNNSPRPVSPMPDDQENAVQKMRVARLKLEHEDLKLAIQAMTVQHCDPLAIQRMKKMKLELKERLERASSATIPDIIA